MAWNICVHGHERGKGLVYYTEVFEMVDGVGNQNDEGVNTRWLIWHGYIGEG